MAEPGTPKTLKTSAQLPGAGAFDTPTSVSVKPSTRAATILVTFTRGSTTSAFAMRVEESEDGTTWYRQTAADGTFTTSAPNLRAPFHALEYRSPVPADNNPLRLSIPINLAGAKYLRATFAEYGDASNPGTLAAVLVEGG